MTSAVDDLKVVGAPATFATKREKPWKAALALELPSAAGPGDEQGVVVEFTLVDLTPNGQPLDVDNLCEPLFSILVGTKGWFSGRRPNIKWWTASKLQGDDSGARISVTRELPPAAALADADYDVTYSGPLPTSATSVDLAAWAWEIRERQGIDWIPVRCALRLEFGSGRINIGDIATGAVKSVVDCLYPWLGGVAGRPEDHRITSLFVAKGVPRLKEDQIHFHVWADDRVPAALPEEPAVGTRSTRSASSSSPARASETQVSNPCRPGTGKYIVCEGAIRNATVSEVERELEANRAGTGSRLREYKADLRSENGLDIAIEAKRLVCRGRL